MAERFHIQLETCSQSQQGMYIFFFPVQLYALVRQLAAYRGQCERETMQVGEAECDNQALRQCQKQKEVSLTARSVWGHAYHGSMSVCLVQVGVGESPWSDTAEFAVGQGGVEENVEIRRSPSPGRSVQTLHLATSQRQSVDRDKVAETRPFKNH